MMTQVNQDIENTDPRHQKSFYQRIIWSIRECITITAIRAGETDRHTTLRVRWSLAQVNGIERTR